MTIGITTTNRQDRSRTFSGVNKRSWLARTTALYISTTAHFGAVRTVALKRAKAWRQGAVVRNGLLGRACASICGIIVANQSNLNHQS
jgi:hypothetical protein